MSLPAPAELARTLDAARLARRTVPQLTKALPDLTLDHAFQVQDEGVRLRVAAGDRVAGYKMGLTSKAKMEQMGVNLPIAGVLLESMRRANGGVAELKGLIHPRIEPELAFILARDLKGRVSPEEALAACSGVCAALEIIDSRYEAFAFKLPDVVADNCSACGFVLGEVRDPKSLDLDRLAIELKVGGQTVASGSSDAIFGHPPAAVAELAAMLASRGLHLPAGSVVLSGAATQAVSFEPGETRAVVQGLGEVSIRAVRS